MLQISGLSKFLLLILLVYLVLSIFFGFPKVTGLLIKSIWQAGKSIVVILVHLFRFLFRSILGGSIRSKTLDHRHSSKRILPNSDFRDYRGIGSNSELLRINNPILVLGRYISANGKRGRIVKASYELLNYGVVIVGPPGSGKTESLMIPMTLDLLYHGHSVVTIDVKGDLYDRLTPNIDQQKIRVILWDCLDPRSLSWNWLTSINSTLDIEGTVQSILGRDNPADPNPFFYHRDYRWLVSLLNIFTHLDIPDKTPDLLYRTLVNQDSIRQLFKDFSVLRPYENELSDLLNFNPGEYSLAVSGLLNALFIQYTAG